MKELNIHIRGGGHDAMREAAFEMLLTRLENYGSVSEYIVGMRQRLQAARDLNTNTPPWLAFMSEEGSRLPSGEKMRNREANLTMETRMLLHFTF